MIPRAMTFRAIETGSIEAYGGLYIIDMGLEHTELSRTKGILYLDIPAVQKSSIRPAKRQKCCMVGRSRL